MFRSAAVPSAARHRRRRWSIGLIAAVVVVGAVSSGCGGDKVAGGTRVLLIGDSLLTHSRDAVQKVLAHDHWDPVVAALPGTTIEGWAAPTATLVANSKPDVVVVELGTNDCIFQHCDNLAASIDALMHSIGSVDLVFWLNVQRAPSHPEFSGEVNDAINAAADRWSSIVVVDLASRFDGHPEWHIPDHLHFNAQGQYQLALLIAEALRPYHP
jgi:lysophospholipase L1-like esterase